MVQGYEAGGSERSPRAARGARCLVEPLERRRLLSATVAAVNAPADDIAVPAAASSSTLQVSTQGGVLGYTPLQIRDAYGFNTATFSNSTINADGAGQTIAIVEAFDDPAIARDLHAFDKQFGLKDPQSLIKVDQTGSTHLPAQNAAWARETALDVEWAHAIAPAANLTIVEAASDHLHDLLAAVDTARNLPNVSVVTMSWGVNEFAAETTLDNMFTTPMDHGGVTFIAASGDTSAADGVQYPSASPNVVSVGGETLLLNKAASYSSLSWSGSVSGVSRFEAAPTYQSAVSTIGRVTPDVSYNANPKTGFAVYDSVPYQGTSGWQVLGGTSAAAPQWAALVAIANQGRALDGQGPLDGAVDTLPALYQYYSNAAAGSHGTNAALPSRRSLLGPGGARLAGSVIAFLALHPASKASASASDLLSSTDTDAHNKNLIAVIFAVPFINITQAAPVGGSSSVRSLPLPGADSVTSASAADGMMIIAGPGLRGFTSAGAISSALIAPGMNGSGFASSVQRATILARAITAWAAPSGGAPPAIIVRVIAGDLSIPEPVVRSVFRVSHVNMTAFLSDAVSQFMEECAAVETGSLAAANASEQPTHLRAWCVTATVLAVDALIVGYALQRRSRRLMPRTSRAPFPDHDSLPAGIPKFLGPLVGNMPI